MGMRAGLLWQGRYPKNVVFVQCQSLKDGSWLVLWIPKVWQILNKDKSNQSTPSGDVWLNYAQCKISKTVMKAYQTKTANSKTRSYKLGSGAHSWHFSRTNCKLKPNKYGLSYSSWCFRVTFQFRRWMIPFQFGPIGSNMSQLFWISSESKKYTCKMYCIFRYKQVLRGIICTDNFLCKKEWHK